MRGRGTRAAPVAERRRLTRLDVRTPPGEHLADTLRELGMSQSELARRMGRPQPAINEIVRGAKSITAETALQIEDVTGVPAEVWLNLETAYRLTMARLERRKATKGRPGVAAVKA